MNWMKKDNWRWVKIIGMSLYLVISFIDIYVDMGELEIQRVRSEMEGYR